MKVDLPLSQELELAEDDGPRGPRSSLAGGAYDPYNVDPKTGRKPVAAPKTEARTDLRKLSEWIKLKREVDEAKSTDDAQPLPATRRG